ncbi:MAG: PDZ domain-containing protein [Planctomycetes bacterium]|nr:PDZ domain-containing protein [Planctomycetota bacterium]
MTDLASYRRGFEADLDGFLPLHNLPGHILSVDFDEGAGLLSKSAPETDGYEEIKIVKNDKRLPTLILNVPGKGELQFLLDLGTSGVTATAIALEERVFDELIVARQVRVHALETGEAEPVIWCPAGEVFGRLSRLEFGSNVLEDVSVARSESNSIQLKLMKKFNFILDLRNDRLYVKKRKKIPEPDLLELSGMAFFPVLNRFEVYSVLPGGPAHRAGVRKGAAILAFNGKPVDRFSCHVLRAALATEGTETTLTIIQDDIESRIVLKIPKRE